MPEVTALLEEHVEHMRSISPPESKHALDVEGLCIPEITFWTAREGNAVLGCGALLSLGETEGEIKAMRTADAARRRGVGRSVLTTILEEARSRGMTRLSLETGSQPDFEPARSLYKRFGFDFCGSFGSYVEDPNSVFMTLELEPVPAT
ncbi:MAG: GNAT family N-acetyltransferase [Planctomycetota bacterium]